MGRKIDEYYYIMYKLSGMFMDLEIFLLRNILIYCCERFIFFIILVLLYSTKPEDSVNCSVNAR